MVKKRVIVNNIPESLETVGSAGFAYEGAQGAEALRPILADLLANTELVEQYSRLARQRALTTYSWEAVTDSYERLCYMLCQQPLPTHLQKS